MTFLKKYWLVIIIGIVLLAFIKPPFGILIFGLIVFCACILGMHFLIKIQKKGIRCVGRILSFQSDSQGDKMPVVEFTSTDGVLITEKPYVYASTDISKFRSFKNMIDKEVLILYDPDDPKKFIIATDKTFNYFALVFVMLIGIIFIVFSISWLLGYIKVQGYQGY